MQDFSDAFGLAFSLILGADADLVEIIGLSLRVSLSAVVLSALIGLPLGALLAVTRFPGRQFLAVLLNALMGLPPVVVGLLVYMAISRAGPLGWLGLLYTPTAMIIAQTILVTPIIAALTRQVVEDMHKEYDEQFRSLCLPAPRVTPLVGRARSHWAVGPCSIDRVLNRMCGEPVAPAPVRNPETEFGLLMFAIDLAHIDASDECVL